MANPNLLNVTSIYAKNVAASSTSGTNTILTCPSNKLIKIQNINIHHDGSTWHQMYINGKQVSGGSTNSPPSDQNLTLGSFYLLEGENVQLSSNNTKVDVYISYEEIDDA
tara:strand:+ start:133 stop:462 length:330 start_codon:yes stop_codon:yes gene_type:complete